MLQDIFNPKKFNNPIFIDGQKKNNLKNPRVLDVGGGSGTLLNSLKLINVNYKDMDIVDIDDSQKKNLF